MENIVKCQENGKKQEIIGEIRNQVYEYWLTSTSLAAEPIMVNDTQKIYDFLMASVYDKESIDVKESFYAVFVDSAYNTKGFIKVGEGGVNGVIVDPKIVFSAALKCLATGIVLTHNHPSGNCHPSEIDRQLTKQLIAGGELLEIKIIDHIIVSRTGYYSMKAYGELN